MGLKDIMLTVGVTSSGRITIGFGELDTAPGAVATLSMESAEWLRDRLFHICARESALRGEVPTVVKTEEQSVPVKPG
jgi:hypothetical protein